MERQRRRSRLRAYGREDQIRPRRVDAAPARAVLQRLLDSGFALERIAIAAGVPHSTLTTLRFGRRGAAAGVHLKTIEAVVAEALLRLEPQAISTSTVPATGTTRRLQALVATGQTQSAIAELLGRGVCNLSSLVHGRRQIVTVGTHDAVKALFDALWDQRPEGPKARSTTQHAGSRNAMDGCHRSRGTIRTPTPSLPLWTATRTWSTTSPSYLRSKETDHA